MARTIQSVDRVVAILEALAGSPQGMSLSALAGRIGVPPQTAQSLLRTLESHALVTQAGRGRPYLVGPKLVRLARQSMDARGPGDMARDLVVALSRRIGEYVLLAELRGRSVSPLVEVSPQSGLVVRSEFRGEERVHTMATGRLLMAFADEATRESIIERLPVRVDRKVLGRQMAEIRKKDVTLLLEEAGKGVAALAVPVRRGERVVAALGIALPLVRFAPARRRALFADARAVAEEIGDRWEEGSLGGH